MHSLDVNWTVQEQLDAAPGGTLGLAQFHPDHDREYVIKRPDHPQMWVSWQGQHLSGKSLLEQGEFTLIWHPDWQEDDGPEEGHEEDVVRVPVLGTANGSDRPRDYEPENWATDGSESAAREALLASYEACIGERERLGRLVLGAQALVENMSGLQEVRRDGQLQKELRELRMLLNGGDAIRKTARADELVEKWLEDPKRSVFGLAADLLDVLGPEKK